MWFPVALYAQFIAHPSPPTVLRNTDTLINAWAGGLGTPHFSHIDYDGDGSADLAAFDRSSQSFLCWQWQNGRWHARPDWALRMPQTLYFALFRDYNGDGKEDLFSYALGGGVQVHKNVSTAGNFQMTLAYPQLTTTMYSSSPTALYVPATDLPAIIDIDGDGDLDFLSFYIMGSYIHLHRNLAVENNLPADSLKYDLDDQCWGKFRESSADNSLILHKTCSPVREDVPQPEHSGSTITLFDKDGDGDWDLLLGDVSYANIVYAQNGKVEYSHPVDSMTAWQSAFPAGHPMNVYVFPAASIIDANHDRKQDVVVAPFSLTGSDNHGQVLLYTNSDSSGFTLSYQTNHWLQDEMIDVGSYACPAMMDSDGDGDPDLLVAGHRKEGLINRAFIRLYENTGTANSWVFSLADTDYLPMLSALPGPWSIAAGDVDGDGDDDLMVASVDGRIRWLENTAASGQPAQWNLARDTVGGIIFSGLPAMTITDVDEDGRNDLLVLVQNSTRFFYFRNTASSGAPVYQQQTDDFGGGIENNIYAFGMAVTDVDGDGHEDMIFSSYYSPLVWVDNFRSQIGNFTWDTLIHTPSQHPLFVGANSFLLPVTLPGDSLASLMVGTARGGITWLKNTNTVTALSAHRTPAFLTLFPQPANRSLTVLASETIRHLTIYATSGQKMYEARPHRPAATIDTRRWPRGVYVARVLTPHQIMARRFLIQR